ncbi:MAG: hypothetical protein ACI8W7_004657, partial [Gammaproteobacteria bacterium]
NTERSSYLWQWMAVDSDGGGDGGGDLNQADHCAAILAGIFASS